MAQTFVTVDLEESRTLSSHFRFCCGFDPVFLDGFEVVWKAQYSVRVVTGQVRFDEDFGDKIRDVLWGSGGTEQISRYCVHVGCGVSVLGDHVHSPLSRQCPVYEA